MKLPIHRVLSVGGLVYILFLTSGLYFKATFEPTPQVVAHQDISLLIAGDADEAEDATPKSRGVNPRPLIEDDDDSAKDLLMEKPREVEGILLTRSFKIDSYSPYQKEATTPPPKA